MNTIEERIRAAAQAAAGTVPPDGVPPWRLPAPDSARLRRWGAPWVRRLTPVAAAAAVVAVILTVVTVSQNMHGTGASAPGTMTAGPPISSYLASGRIPPYYIALAADGNPQFHPSYAVIHSTATGAALGTVAAAGRQTVVAVSAAANDRTFVLDEQQWPQVRTNQSAPHSFILLRLGSGGQVTSLGRLGVAVPSGDFVTGLALSPDGRRLAVAVDAAPHETVISVYTLATGAVRTWASSGGIGYVYGDLSTPVEAGTLAWTTDQRTLAFDWLGTPTPSSSQGVWLLNLTLGGGNLLADSRQAMSGGYPSSSLGQAMGIDGTLSCQGPSNVTPDGSAVICSTSAELGSRIARLPNGNMAPVPRGVKIGFVEYSTATGKITHVIGPWTIGTASTVASGVLWSNPSGSVLIGEIPAPGNDGATEVGVISGNDFTPLASASAQDGTW